MDINLNTSEYKTLVEMLELAQRVLFTHETDEDCDKKRYEELDQRILSYAETFQFENSVTFDNTLGKYLRSNQLEGNLRQYVDEFETATLFNHLMDQLTIRDLIKQEGEEALRQMTLEKRMEKYDQVHQAYLSEFEQNGLDNLTISP